ncbi:MAG: OmpL47-type beta-barrel domain-containing protein [Thermoplasmatota archaeon]
MKKFVRDRTIFSKKLTKTTTFITVLIVAVAMILSSVVTATVITSNKNVSTKTNEIIKINTNGVKLQVKGPSMLNKNQQTGQESTNRDDHIFKFHSGFNNNAIGFTGAMTWEGAMRLTPDELGGYSGWNITKINYYYYDSVSINGKVKIYHGGTSTTPGALWEEVSFTHSTPGLKETVLPTPIPISGTEDIWVSIEWQQLAAGYPFGIDAGPAVDGKGDWIYFSGAWAEIQDYGLDYNWVLEAYAVGELPSHDVGVTSITSPSTGTATSPIVPKATVQNFGTSDETNVPVDFKITSYGTPSTLWSDGFETYVPGNYVFPPGWTIQTTNPTGRWFMYASSLTYSATTYPRVQEAGSDGNAQDESLISPTIDCSGLSWVHVQFTKYFYASPAGDATFTLYISNDGGSNWIQLVQYTATSSIAENINVTTYAAGQSNVKFRFRFESPADATLTSYMYFDNFWVGQYSPFGPMGDNPPVGWQIVNYPSNPPTWNNNYWHRYTSLYTSYDSMYYPARIYYASPYEDVNCALITPSIDCSGLSTVYLYINGYFYYYAGYTHGCIEISTDGGSNWNLVWDYTATMYHYEFPGYNNFDITSWAAGQSNVKIRFRYYHTAAEQGRYWYLSNVRVGDGSGNFIFFDSFQGPQAYSTNFKQWQPDDWYTWIPTIVTGTMNWQNVMSGSSPTCTPHGGTRMAFYNSYSATAGSQALLKSLPLDVSSANALKMKFWMFHDSVSYQTTADKIDVLVSTNGVDWTNVGTYYRSCTLQGLPLVDGWREWIIDLSDYEDETALRIGFLATSQYGYNMYIDDVEIFDPGYILEYSQTAYVNVNAGQTVEVSFTSWTPPAWHNQQNVDITYDAYAATDLSTDTNPDNDFAIKTFVLHYPFFHDVEVLSIDSPVNDGPGKTYPVKCTIKNVGQYPERNFFIPMQIGEKIYITDGWFNNFETNDGGFVQSGGQWEYGTPTSGPMGAYSGTKLWATKLAGNYVQGLATLTTCEITVPAGGDLSFWHWYDFEASYDGYNVKISTPPYTTWTLLIPVGGYTGTANSANPLYPQPCWTGHVQKYWEYETFDLSAYEGQTVKFRFDMGADSSVFYPGAYIDDILVGTLTIEIDSEYDESQAVISWLNPGETKQLTYPDWTPENLGIGTSGDIEYGVLAQTLLPGDGNTANDQVVETIILSYWHDVKVKSITSPVDGGRDLLFHQRPFLPSESWIFRTSAQSPGYLCQDDFWDLTAPIGNIEFYGLCLIYSGGWIPGNQNTLPFEVKFYEDGGTAPGAVVATYTLPAITPENTGQVYAGFTMYKWTYDITPSVSLEDGWISIQSTTAPDGAWLLWAGSPEGNLNMWQQGASPPQIAGDCAFNLSGTASPVPPVQKYVAPGVQSISSIVSNEGTFVETGLTCYAEIWEYISSENGTIVYQDQVDNINLNPLGDEKACNFDSFNFENEGIYGLFFNIPLSNDDVPNNNMKSLGIGVDATKPQSTHTLTPAAPDGLNGWYVSNVKVKLTATDPEVNGVSSGVKEIRYKIDGGAEQVYSTEFSVTTDGQHTVTYWAVDKVGNAESPNSVSFKIDKTKPEITLEYEVTGGNQWTGWELTFTATATDEMSGMDRVEFYLNYVLQETVTGPGPTYVWVLPNYNPIIKVTIKAVGYDMAGHNAFDQIEQPKPHSNEQSVPNNNAQHTTVKINLGR